MVAAAVVLLLVSVAGCAWAYLVYPWILLREARRRQLVVMARDIEPPVSVIIPVHNRAADIRAKLANTLALDYPPGCLEILVVSDGSTDGTNEAVGMCRDPRVRLIALPRGGKLVALQQAARRATGEILVFTDANVSLDPGALRQLVRNFADGTVGGVVGARKVRRSKTGDTTGLGEVLFARFEIWLRGLESRLWSVPVADAALWGVRRVLFVPARQLGHSDDLALAAPVVLRGKRLVFEPRAVCRKEAPADAAQEFRRRIHAFNYTLRTVLDLGKRLRTGRSFGLQLLSHTVARALVPLFLAGLLAASLMLALATGHVLFVALLEAQLLFYLLALLGWKLRASPAGATPILSIPAWIASFHMAALFGLISLLSGLKPAGARPNATRPAPRSSPGLAPAGIES